MLFPYLFFFFYFPYFSHFSKKLFFEPLMFKTLKNEKMMKVFNRTKESAETA